MTHIALRSWSNLHHSNEFRAFIASDDIVAISQRHTDAHFEHLHQEAVLALAAVIQDWWQGGLAEDWPHTHCESPQLLCRCMYVTFVGNFADVMDVYVTKSGSVRLIDLSPFATVTDGLLFSWDELQRVAAHVAAQDAQGSDTAPQLTSSVPVLEAVPGVNQCALGNGAVVRTVGQAGVCPSKLALHGLPTDIVQLASSLAAGEVPEDVAAYAQGTAGAGEVAHPDAAALQEASSVDAMVAAMKAADQ